jgi:hypothetical protein
MGKEMVGEISKCHMCSKFFDSKKDLKDHMDQNHRIIDHHMAVSSSAAERIVDDILSSNDGILVISVMDTKGNTLSAKSRESFRESFEVASQGGDNYGGALALATLSVVNQVRDMFGEPQAIITIHKDCKLMLLPIPSYEIMVGVVLERWVDADDDNMANNIQRLVADTVVNEIINP